MFVLGIVILIVSFVIALISLVREQRKNEQSNVALSEESKQTVVSFEEQQAQEEEAVVKRHDEAAKRLLEMVKKQEAANVVDEAQKLKNKGQEEEVFPWLKPNEEIPSGTANDFEDFKTVGDSTEEIKVDEKSPVETFDDITATSVDDVRTLTGVIELRRQAKEKKKAA